MSRTECHALYQHLFPKVLFGDLSIREFESISHSGETSYEVVRSALRNETLCHILKKQPKPSPAAIALFLKEKKKKKNQLSGKHLAKAFARKFGVPPYSYLKKTTLPQKALSEVAEWDTYTGPRWQQQSSLQAGVFEDELAMVLKRRTKTFWREKDLLQKKISNVTPDFLLCDKSEWWDAKNYYGCPNHFTKSVIGRQAKKYMEAWPQSKGFIVFRYGFHPKLQSTVPPNVTLLSWYDLLKN